MQGGEEYIGSWLIINNSGSATEIPPCRKEAKREWLRQPITSFYIVIVIGGCTSYTSDFVMRQTSLCWLEKNKGLA